MGEERLANVKAEFSEHTEWIILSILGIGSIAYGALLITLYGDVVDNAFLILLIGITSFLIGHLGLRRH